MYRISDAAIELNSMKKTFGQYVSRDILDYVLNHSKNSSATEHYGVVLFSDIRNFTTLMENNTSKETVSKLNEYFVQMASIIEKNGGYINKFIGDAILAVFTDINLPKKTKMSDREKKHYYSLQALKTAKEMSVALKKMNKKWQNDNKQEICIGIGLHAGNIIMGNVGSENRMEFACLGKTIIDTMDVEDLTKKYGKEIIVSRAITANKDFKLTLLTDDPKIFKQPLYYVDMEERV
jgi:adenylate cyclase